MAYLLGADRIGITVGEETFYQYQPEQTTSAIICHHPQAKCSSPASPGRTEMLTKAEGWLRIAEIKPSRASQPPAPQPVSGLESCAVTDNVFGRIRVSPYAFSARITHDTPDVHPTVVVSTRTGTSWPSSPK